jgi:hypothetical protein
MRYRLGGGTSGPLVSPTLARRVLYGAFFFYVSYCAHLAAFTVADVEPAPPAVARASVAPVESGTLEPVLAFVVRGRVDVASVVSWAKAQGGGS